jgi:hypothetical protein
MTHFKHMTLIALVTFLGAATFGCDTMGSQGLTPTSADARFATAPVATESTPQSTLEDEEVLAAEVVGSIEDVAHTATTQADAAGAEPVNTSMFDGEAAQEPAAEVVVPEESATETTVTDETSVEEPAAASPIAEIFEHASDPVAWSPTGTYKLPSYGAGCRFTTDAVIQIPSNGLVDDSLVFQADAGQGATLELVVATPDGQTLTAEVDMKRGLTGRSYRQATGDAAWSDSDGEHAGVVVDGTICFDEKLANGLDDVLAEFSLVVELDGVYYAMGGNVLLEGPQVAALDGFTVNGAGSVDIDLR